MLIPWVERKWMRTVVERPLLALPIGSPYWLSLFDCIQVAVAATNEEHGRKKFLY
jgi:hypothetical protein